jgi:ribosomal protein L15
MSLQVYIEDDAWGEREKEKKKKKRTFCICIGDGHGDGRCGGRGERGNREGYRWPEMI